MRNTFLTGLAVLMLFISCKHDTDVTPDPVPSGTDSTTQYDSTKLTPYELVSPAFFPPIVVPDDNKPYVERIQLGRRLYYDPILSNDGRSCAQCHIQSRGFTSDHISADGLTVMPHVNLAWNYNWLWYGGEQGAMEDKIMLFEVHDFFMADINRINADTTYHRLFKQTYGVDKITFREVTYALSQFIRTMISQDSKFYRSVTGKTALTRDEEAGRQIFFTEKGDCFHCHSNPLLSDNIFHNNGLDSDYSNPTNRGRYNVTGNAQDMGKFRTANLHNVALRHHFMHDGRFKSLDEVIDFYNDPPKPSATLDPIMKLNNKEQVGLKLSDPEKAQLKAFLLTFTDSVYISNPAFSKPQ